MAPNTIEQDAASELLIAQLIAADFDLPMMDSLLTFPSSQVEDHTKSNNNDDTSPTPHDERTSHSSEAEQFKQEAENLNPDSSATGWAAEGMDHGERPANDPDTAPLLASEDMNWSSNESSGGTTAPTREGEGNSRLQQDETVWCTPRENRDEGHEDDSEGEVRSDAAHDSEVEDGNDDEQYNKKDEEGFEEEKYDDILEEGIIWIPSPGERRIDRRWVNHTRETPDIKVAEVIVGDDETLEGILAAMVL